MTDGEKTTLLAEKILGWKAKVTFEELIGEMMEAEIAALRNS